MANLSGVQLDANVQESTGEFTVLPAGEYEVVITGDELKQTTSGTGTMLVLSLQVTKGQYTGTEITDRLNIINQNATAQAIGQGTLKRICSLCNVPYPCQDTTPLYGRPMIARVKVEEFVSNKSGETLQSNKITAYKPVQQQQYRQQQQQPQHQPAATLPNGAPAPPPVGDDAVPF